MKTAPVFTSATRTNLLRYIFSLTLYSLHTYRTGGWRKTCIEIPPTSALTLCYINLDFKLLTVIQCMHENKDRNSTYSDVRAEAVIQKHINLFHNLSS